MRNIYFLIGGGGKIRRELKGVRGYTNLRSATKDARTFSYKVKRCSESDLLKLLK